jgi:hypothetical protein
MEINRQRWRVCNFLTLEVISLVKFPAFCLSPKVRNAFSRERRNFQNFHILYHGGDFRISFILLHGILWNIQANGWMDGCLASHCHFRRVTTCVRCVVTPSCILSVALAEGNRRRAGIRSFVTDCTLRLTQERPPHAWRETSPWCAFTANSNGKALPLHTVEA